MRRSTLSILCLVAMLCLGLVAPLAMAGDGPLANATVSFGQWKTDPPLDRLSGNPAMGAGNNHELIPNSTVFPRGLELSLIQVQWRQEVMLFPRIETSKLITL